MQSLTRRILLLGICFLLALTAATAFAQTTDISSNPASLSFANTYIGKASGSKSITITNLTSTGIVIVTIAFDCPGFGISSGVAPFSFGATQNITHYSIFFQPTEAKTYNCNFVLTLNDGTFLNVPMTGTGLVSKGIANVSPTTMSFPNQPLGSTSAPQTVTITNSGTAGLEVDAITLSPSGFTTNSISLPYTIPTQQSLPVSVYYTPNHVASETGAIDFTFKSVPDMGTSLSGNGVASASLAVATSPTLPQATQNAAYRATLTTSAGTGPFSWSLASGSTLPLGLSLSSAGLISGTLDSSVGAGNYTFTVQVSDSTSTTASRLMTLGVFANLGDNCNDISFNVPNTSTPMVALNDLGTGTYQGSQGGLYPNGSNVRPTSHDADGVAFAKALVPLDGDGNYSPTGKMVLMAIGESTAQNEFNRFLPIANSDPTKNPNVLLVNGAQGGATPNNFTAPDSVYWSTVLNNYLPQNGVTANQVVAIWMEDTDGIATGTFPSDIADLQSQYETMMQTMHTLFPNLKLVYFSSRTYGGYSNGVGHPDNPEPYAFEVGYAVKWAIQDQLNGNSNLNYDSTKGAVVAPWMSWGPYYWSNGMLGRNDGFVWNCADFSSDGTHPSSQFGQLKVATALLNFLKTDDTTIPWYLAPSLALSVNGGNNQTGSTGSLLPVPLTVLASNLNGGGAQSGVSVAFSDGGAGGTFGTPVATTDSNGIASTTYTLPTSAKTVTINATSAGYRSAVFTETSTSASQVLAVAAGNNQTANLGATLQSALVVLATKNGNPVSGVSVQFSDGGAGGTFGTPVAVTGSNGKASSTYTVPTTAKKVTVTASSSGYSSATFTENAVSLVTSLAVVSGGKQTGTVGTTLPLPIVIRAKNGSGKLVVGAPISFSDGGVGGSFSPNPAITNSSGQASTSYTLPTAAKSISVTAADGVATTGVSEKSVAGTPTKIAIVGGNNQSGNTNTTLPKKLMVLISDQYSNPVSGVTVNFTDGGAGGSFSNPNPVTGTNGQVSVSYTTGPTTGTVTISASTSTLGPVHFTETVK